MLERHLRHWLNNAYGGQCKFIEPTYGSSLGMPDVEVPLGKRTLPVELKIGCICRTGGLSVQFRPSQMRYHILEAKDGRPTAILVAVGGSTKFDVYVFAGRYVEHAAYMIDRNVIRVAEDQRWTDTYYKEALDLSFKNIITQYECEGEGA